MTLRTGDQIDGRYEVLAELGTGSHGVVYQARQHSTGQLVALKVLNAAVPADVRSRRAERFARELHLCAKLEHPHIVRLIDAGTLDGVPFLAFAFVPGQTLRTVLDREGCLSWTETVHLASQVLDALACAHALGVVHRDMKPENVMVTDAGARRNAVVLDFGLGNFTEPDQRLVAARLTATQEILGTPCYAAPEQLRGEPPTTRSDLYSWGLIFLECLSGSVVVSGASTQQVLQWQLGDRPIPIPTAIRDVRVRRMLANVTSKSAAARDVPIPDILRLLSGADHEAPRERLPMTGVVRRQITVLCVGVALRGRSGAPLDPEDEHAGLQEAFEYVARTMERHGGRLVQTVGDAGIAVFGHPHTREDDTRRAAHAALDVLAGIERLNAADAGRVWIATTHMGLHVGPVLLGSGDDPGELALLGTTATVALQLRSEAGAGAILVREAGRRALRRHFALVAEGAPDTVPTAFRLRGVETPTKAGHSISDDEMVPLIGREPQLGRLSRLWQEALAGRTGSVLVVGEPGIGKSRLLRELRRRVPTPAWLELRCGPEAQDVPLRPVIDWFASLDLPLEQFLAQAGVDDDAQRAVLASLAGVETVAAVAMTPDRQKDVTIAAICRLVAGLGREQPIVLAIEDLHWADPSTLEVAARLAQAFDRRAGDDGPTAGGCLVLSARGDFVPPAGLSGVDVLPLAPLSPQEVEALAEAGLERREQLTPQLLEALVRQADGVPLFVEEVTRVLCDESPQEGTPERPVPVPSSLWDLLASRLDALSASARDTAQLAAVLGREFDGEVLRAVSPVSGVMLTDDLNELLRSGLVHRRRTARGERYAFKHALVRDVAYESSMRAERQQAHRRVALVLQGRFPEIERGRPEMLAWHFEQGGDAAAAIEYRRRTGDVAMRRGAYAEAISQYQGAHDLVPKVTDEARRSFLELGVTESLGTALLTTKGYAAPEVDATFGRARALCERLGADVPLRVLYGLWGVHLARSDPEGTAALLPRFRALAERSNDPAAQVVFRSNAGTYAFLRGDFAVAVDEMRASLELQRTGDYQAFVREYGYDLAGYAYGYLAGGLWALGDLREARRVGEEMLAVAEGSGNPYLLTVALGFGADLGHKLRDPALVDRCSGRGIAIATEQKIYFWLGPLLSARGWLVAQAGQRTEGVELIRQGLGVYAATGVRATYRCYLAYLIEVLLADGRIDEGLEMVDQNLAPELPRFDVFCDADLARLKGELLAARGDLPAGRACIEEGIAMSRRFGSRTFELRAVTSLARVLERQGQGTDACASLTAVLAGFEGQAGAPDVDDARVLQQRLA